MKLDKFDLKILRALQADARHPAARIGEAIGLTPSPTWERVRRLEQHGILRGYHADIAVEHLDLFAHALVGVVLARHRIEDFRRFEEGVTSIAEIVECWAVGGETDYMLRFVCPSDAWQDTLRRVLHSGLGVEQYWTYQVTRTLKPFAGVPLDIASLDAADGS